MFHPFFVFIDMGKKKACLISGGGSWGAYGGGTLERIDGDYDTVIGVSTGSLLASHTALREWEYLKNAYITADNNDVYDGCWYKGKPFTKKGRIRKLPVLMTLLLGQKTIYTSHILRKRIDEYFHQHQFDELRNQNKEVLVGAQNFAQVPSKIHYFNSMDEEYEDFKDWIWCSANLPFFTSMVKKSWRNGGGKFHVGLWGDGGLTDLIGLDQLSMRGYKEIDIILHRVKNIDAFEGNKIHTLSENINTTINVMRHDIEFDYFYEKIKRLNKQGTKVTIYWLPRKLSANSLVFNSYDMEDWWDEGYETAFDSDRIEIFEPTKRKF